MNARIARRVAPAAALLTPQRRRCIPRIVATGMVALALTGCGAASHSTPSTGPAATTGPSATAKHDMDKRTRLYISALSQCHFYVAAWSALSPFASDAVALSSVTAEAKTACDDASSTITSEADFDDQAVGAFATVEKCKNGLGDFSDYIDTGAPSKAASAQVKLADCTAFFTPALAAINNRRAASDLPKLSEAGKAIHVAKTTTPAPAAGRTTVSCRVGQTTGDRHEGLLYSLEITMTKPLEDGYMPRCGVADYTADAAWGEDGINPRSFTVGGARWTLGRVTCTYRDAGSGDNQYIAGRCAHGTTVVTFGMGN